MNFPDPGTSIKNKLNNTSDLAVDKKLILANSAHNTLTDLSNLTSQILKVLLNLSIANVYCSIYFNSNIY